MSEAPAVTAVKLSAFLLAEKRQEAEAAEEELAVSIRAALRMNVPAAAVAEAAGISRARVYQIRDGRR